MSSFSRRVVDAIGESEGLDGPASALRELVRSTTDPTPMKNLLSGTWLGHRLHPMLTDVVIGTWLSAGLLDLVGGRDAAPAADRLVEAGAVAAGPTALAGLSDYADLYDHGGRVAFVHALVMDVALVLQIASAVARRRGRRGLGLGLSFAGLGVMGAGGWLGGHLSYVLGVGVDHTAFDEGPKEFVPVADVADVGQDPMVVTAGEHEVLLARVNGAIVAYANRCTHAGWPIADGEREGTCLTCPAHGSTFDLRDGSVVRGPAASPQLRYDVRVDEGRVLVRGPR